MWTFWLKLCLQMIQFHSCLKKWLFGHTFLNTLQYFKYPTKPKIRFWKSTQNICDFLCSFRCSILSHVMFQEDNKKSCCVHFLSLPTWCWQFTCGLCSLTLQKSYSQNFWKKSFVCLPLNDFLTFNGAKKLTWKTPLVVCYHNEKFNKKDIEDAAASFLKRSACVIRAFLSILACALTRFLQLYHFKQKCLTLFDFLYGFM